MQAVMQSLLHGLLEEVIHNKMHMVLTTSSTDAAATGIVQHVIPLCMYAVAQVIERLHGPRLLLQHVVQRVK